jgi:hypothetical protein
MTPRRILAAWLAVALCLAAMYPTVRGARLFAAYAVLRAVAVAAWLYVVVRVALDRLPLSRPALASLVLGGGVAGRCSRRGSSPPMSLHGGACRTWCRALRTSR